MIEQYINIDPGLYDDTYQCTKCGAKFNVSADAWFNNSPEKCAPCDCWKEADDE